MNKREAAPLLVTDEEFKGGKHRSYKKNVYQKPNYCSGPSQNVSQTGSTCTRVSNQQDKQSHRFLCEVTVHIHKLHKKRSESCMLCVATMDSMYWVHINI